MIKKKIENLDEVLENTVETVAGYPVKDLVNHKGQRKYIGGLVKDPIYGRPHFNDGFIGCSWHQDGEAMGKGDKKPRKDLALKFGEVKE